MGTDGPMIRKIFMTIVSVRAGHSFFPPGVFSCPVLRLVNNPCGGRSRGANQGVGTCIPCSWRRAESPSTSPPFLASPPVTRQAEEEAGIGDGRDTGAGRGWQGQTSPRSPEPPAGASAPRSRSRPSRAGCVSDEWPHLSSDGGDEFVCRSR